MLQAQHQRLARDHLLQRVGVAAELVADGGANEVCAVAIEAFVYQQVDLAEIDEAEVDGDLFGIDGLGFDRHRFGVFCHVAIL